MIMGIRKPVGDIRIVEGGIVQVRKKRLHSDEIKQFVGPAHGRYVAGYPKTKSQQFVRKRRQSNTEDEETSAKHDEGEDGEDGDEACKGSAEDDGEVEAHARAADVEEEEEGVVLRERSVRSHQPIEGSNEEESGQQRHNEMHKRATDVMSLCGET